MVFAYEISRLKGHENSFQWTSQHLCQKFLREAPEYSDEKPAKEPHSYDEKFKKSLKQTKIS